MGTSEQICPFYKAMGHTIIEIANVSNTKCIMNVNPFVRNRIMFCIITYQPLSSKLSAYLHSLLKPSSDLQYVPIVDNKHWN